MRKKIDVTEEEKIDTHAEDVEVVEDETLEAEDTEDAETESLDDSEVEPVTSSPKKRGSGKFKHFLKTKKGKILAIIAGVILLLAIILAVPFTRYATLGLVIKKDVTIVVQDASTSKPVSDAEVTIGTVVAKTDSRGIVTLKSVPVGQYDMKIDKQYYKDYSEPVTVPIFGSADRGSSIVATGRPIEITVTNSISGDSIADAKITISDTTVITNSDGIGTIVLPVKDGDQTGTIERDGYNTTSVSVDVSKDQAGRAVTITPAGKILYLSKATGTINVMKANLDGTDATVVVQGSGTEDNYATSLLATRDWRYGALQANRDGDKDKLYIVSPDSEGVKTIDDTAASYTLIGWQGHTFFYRATDAVDNYYTVAQVSIRAYNADTGKLTTIDKNEGAGNTTGGVYQYFTTAYIMDKELVYLSAWALDQTKKPALISVDTSSLKKSIIKEFDDVPRYGVDAKLYEPRGLYIRIDTYDSLKYYEYEDGKVKSLDITDEKYYGSYPTYLLSPSGGKTFWYEERDGKNTIFVGDVDGKNGTQIASLSDYKPYGWYGANDQYLLFSKDGSELYIAPADRPISDSSILKITNYHKPAYSYSGYGSGYGGQ